MEYLEGEILAKSHRGEFSFEQVREIANKPDSAYDILGIAREGSFIWPVNQIGFNYGHMRLDCGLVPHQVANPKIGDYEFAVTIHDGETKIVGVLRGSKDKEFAFTREFIAKSVGEIFRDLTQGELSEEQLHQRVKELIDRFEINSRTPPSSSTPNRN